jgi:preprotein translocase subunit SecE
MLILALSSRKKVLPRFVFVSSFVSLLSKFLFILAFGIVFFSRSLR